MRYFTILCLFFLPTTVLAQRDAKIPDPDPEVERKTFKLPEGFEVNLFAADPLLMKPIHMNFDAAGRLWLACSENYPQIKPGQKHSDKIIVLEDKDGDGKADKTTVFADGLLIPTGLEPGDGGVYVVDSTDLLHLSDTDGDGKADKRRVVLSGFGTEDTHHLVHTLRWGPDGMLYFTQSIYIHSHIETPHGPRRLNAGGIWRFRPETMQLDVFARGWINSWGHHFDRFGQSFVTDGAGGEGVNYVVPGAAYPTAHGVSRILHGLNPGSPKYCGCEIVSGRHLPDDWQGNLITNDFRGHRVCRFVLKEDGSAYAAAQQVDLISSNHPAFRPVDVKMGPDGAIYIADWYNPIIQHGEVDFRDPRRDQTHGRIWRITAKGRPLVKRPQLVDAKTEDLFARLSDPEDWTRHFARRVLKERGKDKVLKLLQTWTASLPQDEKSEPLLLEALWTYQSIDVVEPALLGKLLEAKDPRIRAAAVRVTCLWHAKLDKPLALLKPRTTDTHPRVRLEAVRALAELGTTQAAETALIALDQPVDKFLDYALWLTTKDLQPVWLPALQSGEATFGGDAKRLTFALQTAGAGASIKPLVDLVRQGKVAPDREENVLALIATLGKPQDLRMVFDIVLDKQTPPRRRALLMEGLIQAARQRRVKPEGDLKRIAEFLITNDKDVQYRSVILLGFWNLTDTVGEVAAKMIIEERLSLDQQRKICEALVEIGNPSCLKALDRLSENSRTLDDTSFATGSLAVAMLARKDATAAARRGSELLATAKSGADDPSEVVAALVAQKNGIELLAAAFKDKKLHTDVAKLALRAARSAGRDTNLLQEAIKKAGGLTNPVRTLTKAQLDAMLDDVPRKGNAARGEAIYRRKDLACTKCHAIAGAGGLVGPDLSSIGASAQIDYLIDSLFLPNKAVKEGYHTVVVTTKKGQMFSGVKVRDTGKEWLLRTAEDKEILVPRADIDDSTNGASLMPEGATDDLTQAELLDLVRFLTELGKVGLYQVGKEKYVRRWQALETGTETTRNLIRAGLAAGASDAPWQVWNPVYSKVNGTLPLDDLPWSKVTRTLEQLTQTQAVLRSQLEVTTPGKVKLVFNSAEGISLWLDGAPIEAKKELVVDLKTGLHTLTVGLEREKRQETLRLEIVDEPGSPAQVRPIGGK